MGGADYHRRGGEPRENHNIEATNISTRLGVSGVKGTEHRAEIRRQCVDSPQDNSERGDQGPLREELPSADQDKELSNETACERERDRRHAEDHQEEGGKRNRASQAAETIKVP